MSGPEQGPPPTEEEREHAVRVLDQAYSDGQIDGDEHQARLTRVMTAKDARHLRWQLLDLQPPPPAPLTRRERFAAGRAAVRSTAGRASGRVAHWWRHGPTHTKVTAGVVVLLFGGSLALAVVQPGSDEPHTPGMAALTAEPDSAERIAAFREAFEGEFGTTITGTVQLDDEVVRVEVPDVGSAGRARVWYLQNGAFNDYDQYATNPGLPVDLAAIDVKAAQRSLDVAFAELGVEEPDDVTIMIWHNATVDAPRISYVVRNRYQESGRLSTDFAGNELRREPFEAPGTDG